MGLGRHRAARVPSFKIFSGRLQALDPYPSHRHLFDLGIGAVRVIVDFLIPRLCYKWPAIFNKRRPP